MTSRLWYGITWPSAIVTLVIGPSLLIAQPEFLQYSFMHIKLGLVLLLYGYHFTLHIIFGQLKKGIVKFSSQKMRVWNEAATILLISIVFVIVVKNALSIVWGIAGLLLVTAVILLGIKVYRKKWKD